MKIKTLLIGEIHPYSKKLLEERTDLKQISNEQFQEQNFPEIEAVILRTFTKLGKKELAKLPKLKYVVSCSVGIDNLDLEELQKRKIEVICCQGTNANSVAEHTIYLMFSVMREDPQRPFFEIKNKTIGILGFGAIGKLVARKLIGLEANIIAFDVIPQDPKVLEELKVEMKSIEEVLQQADLITIHIPLNKHTEKLINEKLLRLTKEKSFLLNTSRAEVIDEDILLKLIKEGKFRGVGLDVYSEKLKEELNKLKKNNIILTEHLAAQGEDSFNNMCQEPIKLFLDKLIHEDKIKI